MVIKIQYPDISVLLFELNIYTGLSNIAYVQKDDGSYEPRDVKLGQKTDDYYHVISGLEFDKQVVTSGNFLIDSKMQLPGKPSLLFPERSL